MEIKIKKRDWYYIVVPLLFYPFHVFLILTDSNYAKVAGIFWGLCWVAVIILLTLYKPNIVFEEKERQKRSLKKKNKPKQ